MPHFQELWEKYRDKGVHFFAIEGEGMSTLEMEAFVGEWGWKVPFVAASESTLAGYDTKSMPIVYVINSFGRCVYQGNGEYEKFIEESLAKVAYPGLGKAEVGDSAKKAAEAFGKGDYTKARQLANEALAANEADEDAKYIVERCNTLAKKWDEEAAKARDEKRFTQAVAIYARIAARFKGSEEGTKADEASKEMQKDADVKKEMKAEEALAKTLVANKKVKGKDAKASALGKFYEKNTGTRAAEKAKELAEAIKASSYFK